MNKIENYLGVANHDIQMANNSQELKSYVASILCENDELQQENHKYKEVIYKAIEYLETATIDPQSMLHYRNCLLEILKGVIDE